MGVPPLALVDCGLIYFCVRLRRILNPVTAAVAATIATSAAASPLRSGRDAPVPSPVLGSRGSTAGRGVATSGRTWMTGVLVAAATVLVGVTGVFVGVAVLTIGVEGVCVPVGLAVAVSVGVAVAVSVGVLVGVSTIWAATKDPPSPNAKAAAATITTNATTRAAGGSRGCFIHRPGQASVPRRPRYPYLDIRRSPEYGASAACVQHMGAVRLQSH